LIIRHKLKMKTVIKNSAQRLYLCDFHQSNIETQNSKLRKKRPVSKQFKAIQRKISSPLRLPRPLEGPGAGCGEGFSVEPQSKIKISAKRPF
jgi:hypothetical protein